MLSGQWLMVNHPVAAIELPWRLMLVANSSQSSQETSFIMLTLRHGAETRTVSNAGKPGPCNHSHWITSIVIDVTSMESLHKLMVFPSHTMYSSLCHVPNRAQTGPKQLRKLTPLCHVTVARSLVFSARKRLSATTQGWSWEVTLWHKAMTHRSSTRHSSFLDCFLETKNTPETRHKFYVITVVVNSTILFARHFRWITSIISPPKSPHPSTNPAWVLPNPDPESQWGILRYLVFSQKRKLLHYGKCIVEVTISSCLVSTHIFSHQQSCLYVAYVNHIYIYTYPYAYIYIYTI